MIPVAADSHSLTNASDAVVTYTRFENSLHAGLNAKELCARNHVISIAGLAEMACRLKCRDFIDKARSSRDLALDDVTNGASNDGPSIEDSLQCIAFADDGAMICAGIDRTFADDSFAPALACHGVVA